MMYPSSVEVTEKEAAIFRDDFESGGIADGLARSGSSNPGYAEWQAIEAGVGAKLEQPERDHDREDVEASITERAFSDSTLCRASDREEHAQKAAPMPVARSLQWKRAVPFGHPISMPAELC